MDCSGKPHNMPAFDEPVIIIFFSVICVQLGVVLVTACAGSEEGELGAEG